MDTNASASPLTALGQLTGHSYISLTDRGNTAITIVLSILPKDRILLIPEEGGWIHYQKAPQKLKLKYDYVHCIDAKLDLHYLEQKLKTNTVSALLYQNPGGYFAKQPMREIYELCKKYRCLVILDASGALGTTLCDGAYADIMVGSFRKIVDAEEGGFISSNSEKLWQQIKTYLTAWGTEQQLDLIAQKLEQLPARIGALLALKKKIAQDLRSFGLVYPEDIGFVQVIKYSTQQEKEKIINYCSTHNLEWTQCPRYIRIKQKAISIEIKRV